MSASHVIGTRYHLHEQLGAGGMGAVYRATDRLTGAQVALKRVSIAPQHLDFNSRSDADDTESLRVALAHEFQMLASLRHPHIITVLDYGFSAFPDSAVLQPFFTMQLLPQPRDLRAFYDEPLLTKVDLLVQLLQALAYLHRRGVIHRDLKPGNAPVVGGTVQVLDFGLAVLRDPQRLGGDTGDEGDDETSGTPAYIAPEVLQGQPASAAADLYAVGVMAYELFAGQHPFNTDNLGLLIMDTVHTPPDLTRLPEAARAVVGRLLAKAPAERFDDAYAAMDALCAAFVVPAPAESRAIRESFLQAARFVGREAEFTRLKTALDAITPPDATPARHEAWLVGGESGVGKSRLLDELRTLALVRGVLVLHGQGVEGGGLPYQLWREVARRLALSPDVDTATASILKELVPDISALLGQPIPNAVRLEGAAAQQRLAITLATLLRQQAQPALLLLEDVHWTAESLTLMGIIHAALADSPVMIVGTYRDDERPDVPDALPGWSLLHLDRLDEAAISTLSASMLGEAGQRADVIDLLQRETEGNAFFLVEVVRALAEDAGQLRAVGQFPLPQTVIAGGVQHIIRRRLARVPAEAWPLLKRAAVAGRALDLAVIGQLIAHSPANSTPLDPWLTTCANAAVLEIADGRWRFAHDKLRETLVADLAADERPALHRDVAAAIEAAYPGEDTYAYTLAEHWRHAGAEDRERYYLPLAAERLIRDGSGPEVRTLLDGALARFDDRPMQMTAHWLLGRYFENLSEFAAATDAFTRSLGLAREAEDRAAQGQALFGLGRCVWRQGAFDASLDYVRAGLDLMRQTEDAFGIAAGLNLMGNVYYGKGEMDTASTFLAESAALARTLDDKANLSLSLHLLGNIAYSRGDFDRAEQMYSEALALRLVVGAQREITLTRNNLANIALVRGDLAAARDYYERNYTVQRTIGDRQMAAYSTNNLGTIAIYQEAFQDALRYYQNTYDLFSDIGDQSGLALACANLGTAAGFLEDYPEAVRYSEHAVALFREIGDSRNLAGVLINLGFLYGETGAGPQAHANLHEGLRLAWDSQFLPTVIEGVLGMAMLLHRDGKYEQAAQIMGAVEEHAAITAEIKKLRVGRLRSELEQQLAPDPLAAAIERGRVEELDTVVAALLV